MYQFVIKYYIPYINPISLPHSITGMMEMEDAMNMQKEKKLDNMNSDMDATLKNLNDEHMRNNSNIKKIQELEQANALLQIKASNGEKSLREQSKEITSLNGRVKEFSDLSSQYKAQIVENKTLRQKLERLERMREGPNWKALYEGLQEQHSKEREMWERKLQEMDPSQVKIFFIHFHNLRNLLHLRSS